MKTSEHINKRYNINSYVELGVTWGKVCTCLKGVHVCVCVCVFIKLLNFVTVTRKTEYIIFQPNKMK